VVDAQHNVVRPRRRRPPQMPPHAPGARVLGLRTVADGYERLVRAEPDLQGVARLRTTPHNPDNAVEEPAVNHPFLDPNRHGGQIDDSRRELAREERRTILMRPPRKLPHL